jgi:hypothetical protein
MMRRLEWAVVVAALAVVGVIPVTARGAEPSGQETEEDRRAAGRLFLEAQRAFGSGDYRHAAESFEAAYKRVPKLPALWNAARAWHRAGEPVRAANLYASYLDKAPPNAPDRASAISSMKQLDGKLGRLEVHAEGFDSVTVDGEPLEGARVYVSPGTHVVEGRKGSKSARETPSATPGVATSVALVVPPDAPLAPPTPPPAPPEPEKWHGFPPAVVAVGAGLTGLSAGLMLWSGLETMGQRATFDRAPTQQNLDSGRSAETRTNVFIGITIGLGVLTGATALFLTDWGKKKKDEKGAAPSARLELGPTSIGVGGKW